MNTQLSQAVKQPMYSDYELGAMDCMFIGEPKENASQEYLDGYSRQYEQEQADSEQSNWSAS